MIAVNAEWQRRDQEMRQTLDQKHREAQEVEQKIAADMKLSKSVLAHVPQSGELSAYAKMIRWGVNSDGFTEKGTVTESAEPAAPVKAAVTESAEPAAPANAALAESAAKADVTAVKKIVPTRESLEVGGGFYSIGKLLLRFPCCRSRTMRVLTSLSWRRRSPR